MSETKLGKVSLTPKGTWDSATAYEALDVVTSNGSSWLCMSPCTDVTPAEGENWMLLAEKGANGKDAENNYELIETIELTEDIVAIERTKKPDGTALNLKKLFVYAHVKCTQGYSGMEFGLEALMTSGGDIITAFGFGPINTTSFTNLVGELWFENGVVHCRSRLHNGYHTTLYAGTYSEFESSKLVRKAGTSLVQFRIDQFNGYPMVAGSKFAIYGVDA